MNRDLETRLRAAYRARADVITENDLTDDDVAVLVADRRKPEHPAHARWIMPVLVAATVAILIAGTMIVARLASDNAKPAPPATSQAPPEPTSAPTTQAPTVSPTKPVTSPKPVLPPTMLANGAEGSRTAIPWSLVGAGWTVVVWSPSGDPNDPAQVIYLVDPLGGRYRIASVPNSAQTLVADVSGDRRHALLLDRLRLGHAYQVDLSAGNIESVPVPSDTGSVEYAEPAGRSIITASSTTVRRVSVTGTVEHTYSPSTAAGSLPLATPDGSHLVFAANTALARMDRNGQGSKTLPVSPGYAGCKPIRWWQPDVVLATCSKGSLSSLWLVPLDGSAPTLLDGPPSSTPNSNAWRIGNETIVAHGPSCGGGVRLDRVDSSGTATPLSIPAPVHNNGYLRVTGVTSDSFYLIINGQCEGRAIETLVRYDYGKRTSTVLFGGAVGGGSVRVGLTLGIDRPLGN
jgi:hypothetical protein